MLVDGWVSRALDPDPLALRDRTPLADIRGAEAINVDGVGHHLVLARHPRRREVLVAPALADAFEHACEQLEIVRLPDGPLAFGDEVVTILEGEAVVQVGGVCPGDPRLVALRSRTGNGCVDPSTWHAVLAAEKVLEGPREQIVDTRPFGRTATTITLADGQLTLSKRPTIVIRSAIHAADPDRVAELVRALAEPATVAPMPAPFTPTEHYSIDDVEIDGAHDVLVRAGELVALHPSPAALAILRRPALTYVDTTRWIEEPSTITRIMVDDVLYRPGAVVGEWTREPAGHFDPALVSALAQTIAQLRAPARTGAVATLHKLSVTFAPPVGASSIHMLELGAPAADGCPALVDNVAITAPLALCTAAFAVAAR
jgi:hypothetical protein